MGQQQAVKAYRYYHFDTALARELWFQAIGR
jgi:hypothetical protein